MSFMASCLRRALRTSGAVVVSTLLLLAGCGEFETTAPAGEGPRAEHELLAAAERTEDAGAEARIRDVFASYCLALTQADGEAAADRVSAETIGLYQQHRDWALTGDVATLKGLSMVNRLGVLLLRHLMEPSALRSMDGWAVFAHGVDQGWIGKDSVVRMGLGSVAVLGSVATAEATMKGRSTTQRFNFSKEDGTWRLDLLSFLKKADLALQTIAREGGMSEDELIFAAITAQSGRQVTDAVWQPLD